MAETDKTNEIMFTKLAEGLDNTSRLTKALLAEIKEGEGDFAILKTEFNSLKENVAYLRKIIVEGNGSSLLTKIALIDQRLLTIDKELTTTSDISAKQKTDLQNLKSEFDDLERRFRSLDQTVKVYVDKANEKERMEQEEMRVSIARSKDFEELERKNRAEIKKEKTATLLKVIGVVVAAIIGAVYAVLGLK